MKTIKIFLASSIVEFERERMALGNFIRKLNDHFIERDVLCKLGLCENLSQAIADKRKQEEYNQEIRDSRLFYMLLGREAGEYTVEEFNVALAQFKASGAPKIFVYFRKLPEGEAPAASLTAFRDRLDNELGHDYSVFEDLDAIKLNLLLKLARLPEVGDTLKFEGGKATIDGREFLSLENLPLYRKNEAFQKLKAERDNGMRKSPNSRRPTPKIPAMRTCSPNCRRPSAGART